MKKILFVCIENSNRSQMAQAFVNMYGQGKAQAWSAGSRPSGVVNPRAIKAMAELGYDLSTHSSEGLDDVPQDGYDYAITMGCGDACPMIEAANRLDWELPDPKAMPPEEFNVVRDTIRTHVEALLAGF